MGTALPPPPEDGVRAPEHVGVLTMTCYIDVHFVD
jgi:hypothetical protein